ncbi:MAG: LacI family DNA-binding transcriptional regulator [Roseiflexaceae bacterium]
MGANRRQAGKPNIRMIAARVGLSASTVSLALRGAGNIPPETRERVLAAARELNYVHNQRTSRPKGEQRRILFVMQDHGDSPVAANPFYGTVLGGVEQECAAQGVGLSFAVLASTLPQDGALPASLRGQSPDGVLLVGPYPLLVVRRISDELGCPLVLVDNPLPGLPYDSVMADDFGGGYTAARHLIELGHRLLAVVIGPTLAAAQIPSFSERYRGVCAAAAEAGLAPPAPLSPQGNHLAIRSTLEQALAQPNAPTALFCVNDDYAVLAIQALRDLGRLVPRDLSVVGFDDLAVAQMTNPPLTTMHNHPRTLGLLGARRLLARIAGEETPPWGSVLATRLVVRESTRALEPGGSPATTRDQHQDAP